MQGSMQIQTCQLCWSATSVILPTEGLLAQKKENNLLKNMDWFSWKHLQKLLRMLRRWQRISLILWQKIKIIASIYIRNSPSYFHLKHYLQAFIKTAATIYKKIQDGVFDVSNEVRFLILLLTVASLLSKQKLACL